MKVTAHFVLALALAAACGACASSIPPGRSAIDSVRLVGARGVDPRDVTDKLATTESPKFLGLFRGIANDYSIYDASVLQRDLARVERYYRGHGFFEAHARGARVLPAGSDHVNIEIVVDEGPPVLNGAVKINGLEDVPQATADAVRSAAEHALPTGSRFDEDAYQSAQNAALRALTDNGFAYAAVRAEANVDLSSHTVDYGFDVTPGIRAVFGPITFQGLDPDGAGPEPQEIGDALLLRVMDLHVGDPYSTAAIDAATQALLDLEVFSAVHVVPGLSDPPRPVVPLAVQVEPTKLRAVRLGAGGEFDEIKTDAHLLFGWEDHDLLGGLRDFSVDLKPGLVFYPTSVSDLKPPTDFFPEEWLRLRFRQPGFLEARTSGFIQPEFNVYPLLVVSNPAPTQPVVGYLEPKLAIGVERRFGKHLFGKLLYNIQGEVPIPYKGTLDSSLPKVVLSFPQLVAQVDFKDDAIHPHSGFTANLDLQVAGVGGTASDVRIQPDMSAYVPFARGITFAVSGTLGLLFPINYGQSIYTTDPAKGLPDNANNTDIQTVYFRGFFSGGPSSNRGYPLRGVAPHGFVRFLNPQTAAMQVATNCLQSNPNALSDPTCSSPVGGFTQWEASAELRFAVSGPFGAALFCDTGDVSQHVLYQPNAVRLNYLHMSCGVGGRYDTPVGPLRLDIGYRIPGLQIVGGDPASDPTFGTPPLILGIPMAIAFGIGEAF